MTRNLPPLDTQMSEGIDSALALPMVGEVVFSRRREWGMGISLTQLEALYEMAFLRVFLQWEIFLEESFTRIICDYETPSHSPKRVIPSFGTLALARADILGARDFVSWAGPQAVEDRSSKYLSSGPHEVVIASNRTRLQSFVHVRNRVAHSSEYARMRFDAATMLLVGRRYRGGVPGRFLRDWDNSSSPPVRWIHVIGEELKSLASQILS